MTDDDFDSLYYAAESYRSSRCYVRCADPTVVPVTAEKMREIAERARRELLAEVFRIAMTLTIDELPADLLAEAPDDWRFNSGRPADLPPG